MKQIDIIFLFLFSFTLSFGQDIPKDSVFHQLQIQYLKSDSLPVVLTLLPDIINTPYSEYKGILLKDSIFFFNATRSTNTDDHDNLFSPYWNASIYYSKLSPNGYSTPQLFDKYINNDNYFNTNFCFNENEDKILFSRCLRDSETELQCTIWESHIKNEKWTKPSPLPEIINKSNCNTTFPHLVDVNDYQILYFSTNRKDGFGEMDLWYSICKNEEYGTPINLGPIINSEGNEITPFYDKKSNTLYFSSDEHENIGGYDIFFTKGALSSWDAITNMGVPFNSEENDFYLTINKENENGYFCSNRPNDFYGSSNKCCNDIYAFKWVKKNDSVAPKKVDSTALVMEEIELILPITLYFDNDQPDPKSMLRTTESNYAATVSDYLARKSIFKSEYSDGLIGEEKKMAESIIENFFTDSIEREYKSLNLLLDNILSLLSKNNNITLTINGYASALHQSEYNLILSERRIYNFINYLKIYKNGIFISYLEGENQQLTILTHPQGDKEAIEKRISNNRQDKKNSIYSLSASLARRIEIVNIKTEPSKN